MATSINSNTPRNDVQANTAERNYAKNSEGSTATPVDQAKPDAAQFARDINIKDGAVISDPRQAADGLGSRHLPGTEIPTSDNGLLADGRSPVNTDGGVKTGPSDGRTHDPLGGAYTMEEKFGNAIGNHISERASGGNEDPNTQGGNPAEFVGFSAVSLLGLAVSPPVAAAAALGAIAVGGMNYVYDAWIADGEKETPEAVDNGADTPEGVSTDEESGDVEETQGGTGGGGDVSEETESSEDVEYVMDNQSTPTPDDTSGDNPNPAPTPDITAGRPYVDARDTVATPADPNQAEFDPAQLQARIDALSTGLSDRQQWAINTGDTTDGVGGTQPGDVDPSVLPDEDPVGDPGSPNGNPNDPA